MTSENYRAIVESAWKLATETGLSNLNAQAIATAAEVDPLDVAEMLPSTTSILLLLLEDIVAEITLPVMTGMNEHDQLFDCFMIYYDSALPKKMAIKRIWHELCWHPLTFLEITPHVTKHMRQVIDYVYPQHHWLKQQAFYLAYQGAAVYSFNAWLNDETLDQSDTMVALDTSLKQAATILEYL